MGLRTNQHGTVTKYTPAKGETAVTVPEGMTAIGRQAFASCGELTAVTLPEGLTRIAWNAFAYCESLAEVDIPASVTEIGGGAFHNTPWLKARQAENPLVIVNGILIDASACAGEVTIPAEVRQISEGAFALSKVTEVTVPEGVTEIPENAFNGCAQLRAVYLPQSVRKIGRGAWFQCKALAVIGLPDTLESVGENAFVRCGELRTAQFAGGRAALDPEYASDQIEMLLTGNYAKKIPGAKKYPSALDYYAATGSEDAALYVKKNCAAAMKLFIETGDADRIARLLAGGERFVTKSALEKAVALAIAQTQKGGSPEVQMLLMNWQNAHFSAKSQKLKL